MIRDLRINQSINQSTLNQTLRFRSRFHVNLNDFKTELNDKRNAVLSDTNMNVIYDEYDDDDTVRMMNEE